MKMYKKEELRFEKGYILNQDNDILSLHPSIVRSLNELETRVQKVNWLEEQPEPCAGPDLNQFKRKSSFDIDFKCTHSNHKLDKMIDEVENFMDSLDVDNKIERMNLDVKDNFGRLIEFIGNDTVIAMTSCNPEEIRIDTPTIGNPLLMTFDDFTYWIGLCYGLTLSEDTENGKSE